MCFSKGISYTITQKYLVFRGLFIMKEIYEHASQKHDFMNAHLKKKEKSWDAHWKHNIDAFEIQTIKHPKQ